MNYQNLIKYYFHNEQKYELIRNTLLLLYLSLAPIYFIPLFGSIVLYKNILFIILLTLSLLNTDVSRIKEIITITMLITIIIHYALIDTSKNGLFNIYYQFLVPISIIYIVYTRNSIKYINYSIYPLTLYSIIYIILSYNIDLIDYDIRTYSFGMLSTNWSILLSIYAIYATKLKLNPMITIIIFFAQLVSGGRCGILTTIIGCLSIYLLNKNYKFIIFSLIILISFQFLKPATFYNNNVNREYVFFPIDYGWSYLQHSLNPEEKAISDLDFDIDYNIDTFLFSKKSKIEYFIKNYDIDYDINTFHLSKLSDGATLGYSNSGEKILLPADGLGTWISKPINGDKDAVIAKRDDTILLFLDMLTAFRIQQNLLAIKLFMEKPFGHNFDDAGEVIVYPHSLDFYRHLGEKALSIKLIFKIHNVFFYNAVRGGIPMLGLLIFLCILVYYIPQKDDKIFLMCCMIPMFFEASIIFGNYNQCLIWWFVFASYYNKTRILRTPLFIVKNIFNKGS